MEVRTAVTLGAVAMEIYYRRSQGRRVAPLGRCLRNLPLASRLVPFAFAPREEALESVQPFPPTAASTPGLF